MESSLQLRNLLRSSGSSMFVYDTNVSSVRLMSEFLFIALNALARSSLRIKERDWNISGTRIVALLLRVDFNNIRHFLLFVFVDAHVMVLTLCMPDFLREDTPVGTSFLRAAAHDDDQGTNAAITYSLSRQNPAYFHINPSTGWIYVNHPISQVEMITNQSIQKCFKTFKSGHKNFILILNKVVFKLFLLWI